MTLIYRYDDTLSRCIELM